MKRILVLIVALSMAASLLAGCQTGPAASSAPQTQSATPATTEPAATTAPAATALEPYEFTVLQNYDWYAPPNEWGADMASKFLSDKFNIKINWVGAGGNPNDKIAALLASDDLPDSIILDRDANYFKMIELGKFLQLDDYIAKYPGYRGAVNDNILKMSAVNGKIYGILNWPTTQPNGNSGWMMNTKIYDQLGKPSLKTLDDLYAYLKAVKSAGIKENGADVVPLQLDPNLGFQLLYVAYGENRNLNFYNSRAWINPATQNYEFIGKDPKFQEMLLLMQKFYNEGLINQDIFVEQLDQVKETCANGRFALVASTDVVGTPEAGCEIWKDNVGQKYYNIMEPISASGDPSSVYTSCWNALGWNAQCITVKAKDPERIFAYYDYVASDEGQILIEYGPQGELWNELDENGYPIYKDPSYSITAEDTKRLGLWYWTNPGMTPFTDNSKVAANNRKSPESRDDVTVWQSTVIWKHSYDATQYTNLTPSGDSDAGIALKGVDDLFKEYLPKIISAETVDAARQLINEMNSKADATGFDKTTEFYTTQWQANLKAMS